MLFFSWNKSKEERKVGTPPTSYTSQKPPRLEKSKKSLRGVSEKSRPTPRKESNMSLRSQKKVIFDSQSLPETRFWLFLGRRPGPLGDSPGGSFLTFRAGAVFDSCSWSAGSQKKRK